MFEFKRKLVHFVGLSVPALYWITTREIALGFAGFAAVCGIIIEVARKRSEGFNQYVLTIVGGFAREDESQRVTGATCYATAAFLAVLLFSETVAVACLLFLALGDSVAALVGTRIGAHKVFDKSVEGSIACLVVCAVVGWALLGTVGLYGAVAATIIEVVPAPVDDNLRIPLVSGGLMFLLI
ncbi:MAG: hypothetical protein PVF58_20235 [Candidatus Methanofastidiosia archaeon]|jgi:dolichol kinase